MLIDNEIGSEYELAKFDSCNYFQRNKSFVDSKFVFSGRTAIELVLLNEPHIRKALLPSYCCNSMIDPFIKRDIKIEFYDVNYKDGLKIELDLIDDVDCILWCNYFGFNTAMPNLEDFTTDGGIIIEDITHSFLSDNNSNIQSDYLVASLRKWTSVLSGGYVASRKKELDTADFKYPSKIFLEEKKLAMTIKANYLSGIRDINKDEFLRIFAKTNDWIKDNYSRVRIDEYSKRYLISANYDRYRDVRRSNARFLYDELSDCDDIKFLFPLDEMDCPLFVPIILNNRIRNDLRNELIKNHIYCPIHWPKPELNCESNLYDLELSLVCDHRYGYKDMKRMAEVIKRSLK